jgi:hypothetical protein
MKKSSLSPYFLWGVLLAPLLVKEGLGEIWNFDSLKVFKLISKLRGKK